MSELSFAATGASRSASERLAIQIVEDRVIAPTPDLPDEMPIEKLQFTTRVQRALSVEGVKTVGEIREKSDQELLSFQNLGRRSVAYLRVALGQAIRR
jgi:DNA-directed RNA polymerase alpha subunit